MSAPTETNLSETNLNSELLINFPFLNFESPHINKVKSIQFIDSNAPTSEITTHEPNLDLLPGKSILKKKKRRIPARLLVLTSSHK